ncbi:hypothetical protein RB653_005873 [Dictyostelium firmibasis]|uniref:EGF-like domain-containing protein n=1 Tax=Dictyostelium firmibasis TaxID=79012 RepID=A0AAN7UDE9_9MYCE
MIEIKTYYFFLIFVSFLFCKTFSNDLQQSEKDCLISLLEIIEFSYSDDPNFDICQIPTIICSKSSVVELTLTQPEKNVPINSANFNCFSNLSKLTLENFLLSEDFLTNNLLINSNNVSLSLIGTTDGFIINNNISPSIIYLVIDVNQKHPNPISMSFFTNVKILKIKGITGQIIFGLESSKNEEIYLASDNISSLARINLSNYLKLNIFNIETSRAFKISDGNFQFSSVTNLVNNFILKGSTFTNLVSAFSVLNKASTIVISNNSISAILPTTHQLTTSPLLNVDLSNNALTGSITQDYCSISKINFSLNKLSGTIPNCFACFMDSTMITNFNGNSFTGLKEVTSYCNEIIPKLRYVKDSNKLYLEGTNLGFDGRITSIPPLTWKMVTPSSLFVADTFTNYLDSDLFSISFPVAKVDFKIRLVPSIPTITSIIVGSTKVLTIQGSDFSNHISLTSVKLTKTGTTNDVCTIISSNFSRVEFNCASLTFSATDIYTLTLTSNQNFSKSIFVRFPSAGTISGGTCPNPCNSKGTCLFDGTCICPSANNSTCNGYLCDINGFCQCKDKSYGDACQYKNCDSLNSLNCTGHGDCNSTTGVCTCFTGYHESDCSLKYCPKGPNGFECSGNVNGKCNNDGTCSCNSPFFGNDCSSLPCPIFNSKECSGHGTCNNTIGKCNCFTDYHESDCSLKYCPKAPNGFECNGNVNGKCNSDGTCTCNPPLFGKDCSSLPCPIFNSKECGGNGACNNTIGKCNCFTNYHESDCSLKYCPKGPNGFECSGNVNGNCNSDGTCKCNSPYFGKDCSSLPCPIFNSKECSGYGTCNNTIGKCNCFTDYHESDCSLKYCPKGPNGFECNGNVNGNCNSDGTCTCKSPYFGNDCSSKPCPGNNSNPCSGSGTCDYTIGICQCYRDFYEPDCSKKYCPIGSNGFECSGNTNGRCNFLNGQCECNSDRQGFDCGFSFNQCPSYQDKLCNGNACNNQTGICSCNPGITLPDCSGIACPSKCSNGAYCDITMGQCKCGPNWSGSDCNIPLHYISSIEPCSTKGGKVSLFGWFGDIHNLISISIGVTKCNNIVATNQTVTCDLVAGTGIKDIIFVQNGVSIIGKNLFRYLNSDESISCLNDCSSNGVCSTTDGICKCDIDMIGFDCSARKPQDLKTTPSPTLSSSSSTDNSTLEIVPISLTNIDFKTGEILISNEDTSFTILLDSLVELDYNGDEVKIMDLRNKWTGSFNSSTERYSFSQPVSSFNGASGKIQFDAEVVKEDIKQYQFASLNLPLDKDGIEITVNITNYQFSSGVNTLQLRFTSFASNNMAQDSESSNITYDNECNERDPESDVTNIDQSKTLNYISIKKNSKVLFGRFINIAISDYRQTFITSEIIEKYSNSSSVTIGLNLPHCVDSCFIDPQFTLSPDYSTFKFSCEVIVVPPSRVWIIVICVVIPVIIVSVALYFGIRYYKKNRYSIRLYTMKKSSAIKQKISLKKVNK